ncbi:hypothetical protein IRT38_00915 (plasmid) [Acinetobacter sp. SK-43]|uniref:hypothetical protein n=1 Tax=Acinetobacter sp. SK-43 TaxID=2785295 RepID=UPI00188BA643|nr:hypothetical protein [Acinetobacter sp. SK-43]MBF4453977.1 hypothetical protein [Acinetobacter sp. SK-43]
MNTTYYSVFLNLSDGESSLSLPYAIATNCIDQPNPKELEECIMRNIASEQGFTFNDDYYETIGFCSVKINRIEEIDLNSFNIIKNVFPNFVSHFELEGDEDDTTRIKS